MKLFTLHTPAVVYDQSCDCGKLKHGTVKRHVLITALAVLGVLAILIALLVIFFCAGTKIPLPL